MNILVTGANGQLGQEIKWAVDIIGNGKPDHFVGEKNYYIFTGHDELDITDEQAVLNFVKDNHISVIVNCAAYTNVEKAQTDRELAYDINAKGPMNLALAASAVGSVLIHISTDYVFGGKRNTPLPPVSIGEDLLYFPDIDRDDCFYGYSKNIGEHLIQQTGCKYLIFRTSWLYSTHGKNFVRTMFERAWSGQNSKVVYDEVGSPTNSEDLAQFIVYIIDNNTAETRYLSKTGVYNFSNNGVASWYDLAQRVYHRVPYAEVTPCRHSEFKSSVNRPSYSVFDLSKTEAAFNYKTRYWGVAVDSVVGKLINEFCDKKENNEKENK